MFAALLKIESREVKDSYGDKTKKTAVLPLSDVNTSGLDKAGFIGNVGDMILTLAESSVVLTAASFVVDNKIVVNVSVITPGN